MCVARISLTFATFVALATRIAAQDTVFFPENYKDCIALPTKEYDVEFESMVVSDKRLIRAEADEICFLTSRCQVYEEARSTLECATLVVGDTKNNFNSYQYKDKTCRGCNFHCDGTCSEAHISNQNRSGFLLLETKRTPFEIGLRDFEWKNSNIGNLKLSFGIDKACSVKEYHIQMVNGTTSVRSDITETKDLSFDIETPNCEGQDVTVTLIDYNDEVVATETFQRNRCSGSEVDFCNKCVSSSRPIGQDDSQMARVSYRELARKQVEDIPVILAEEDRDSVMQIAEITDIGPFWVAYTRNKKGVFTWPNGSTSLSMFHNGNSFSPSKSQGCSKAFVDIMLMELMIEPVQCEAREFGFYARSI